MEYQIVSNDSEAGLEEMIKRLIKRGWRPQGGVSVSLYYDNNACLCFWFSQAMIKEN